MKIPKLPSIVLAGRTNVGKSTLYNRIKESTSAVVSPIAGTTRDRNEAVITWQGVSFLLVDTAGLDIPDETEIDKQVIEQSTIALKHADYILLVVDAKSGLIPPDKDALRFIRTFKKPILLVANKADNPKVRSGVAEFHMLGAGNPIPVSGINGSGTGDLLDIIVNHLPYKIFQEQSDHPMLAIIGEPNVGKSSLLNAMLRQERAIVSPIPHTTRDPIDMDISYKDHIITLVDTAGLRRPQHIESKTIEKVSTHKTIEMMKRATIVALVIDITKNIARQTSRLGNLLVEYQKSVFIVANKWDLIPDKDTQTINKYHAYVHHHLGMLSFAPIVFTSAIEKQRVNALLDTAILIYSEQKKSLESDVLENFLRDTVTRHLPTRGKGINYPKIISLKQVAVNPPVFVLKLKAKTDLHHSYIHYLERRIREEFGFVGVPIKIVIEKGKD